MVNFRHFLDPPPPNDLTDAQLKEHPMVTVGNPDEVNRKLETFAQAGLDQVIFFKQAGRIPHKNIMRSISRIGQYVIPYFNPHKAVPSEETLFSAK